MTATIATIADGITSTLNAATFSLAFTAVRAYQPVFDLADLSDLSVSVVPSEIDAIELASRVHTQRRYRVDIIVQKRVDITNTDIDALTTVVEEIIDELAFKKLITGGEHIADCIAVENNPVADSELLNTKKLFFSVVQTMYDVVKLID